ncbi:hypothetical protein [Jannaschia sp. 2305UL9-9]|uniref:hypothetical protein n=1 Tax=Jannaschia sp. 2305UL9-9 TaxID=3121638 RepID=UPI0035282AFF
MKAKERKAFEAFLRDLPARGMREARPDRLPDVIPEVRKIASRHGADPDAVAEAVERVLRAQGEGYWDELDERGSLDTLRRAAKTVSEHLDHMGTQTDLVEAAVTLRRAEDRERAAEIVFDLLNAFDDLHALIRAAHAPAKIDGNTNKEVFELVATLDECWPGSKKWRFDENPTTDEHGNPADSASPAHHPMDPYTAFLYGIVREAKGVQAARGVRSILETRARKGRRARRPTAD